MEKEKEFCSTVAQMCLEDGGMSYVVQLVNGKFIIIDGGENFQKDGGTLYSYLCEKSQRKTIVIAAWFFTHGHSDHIHLATEFIKKYHCEIIIENIFYNIPTDVNFCGFDKGKGFEEKEKEFFQVIDNLSYVKKNILHTGENFVIANARIDILSTAFEYYPNPPTNRNHTSAILKITFSSGKSFMVLGDSEGGRLEKLLEKKSSIYSTEEVLKSDILQVAHHGLHLCEEKQYVIITQLYQKIAPRICFWPIEAERFFNDPWCQSRQYPYNRFLLDTVKEKNFHQSQTVVVDMDNLSISIWKVNKE